MAVAWVRYRNIEAALKLGYVEALKADAFYPYGASQGSSSDLRAALADGRLVARGALAGGTMQPIPAVEWVRLDVLPRYGDPPSPYSHTVIAQVDLLRVFPPHGGQQTTTQKKPLPDNRLRAWLVALESEGDSLPQTELLQLALAAHPNNAIPRSQIRRIVGPRKRGPKGSAEK